MTAPQLHVPGECPDPIYGYDCDGVGVWGPDPYLEEIEGDSTPLWMCEGCRYGAEQDI